MGSEGKEGGGMVSFFSGWDAATIKKTGRAPCIPSCKKRKKGREEDLKSGGSQRTGFVNGLLGTQRKGKGGDSRGIF